MAYLFFKINNDIHLVQNFVNMKLQNFHKRMQVQMICFHKTEVYKINLYPLLQFSFIYKFY